MINYKKITHDVLVSLIAAAIIALASTIVAWILNSNNPYTSNYVILFLGATIFWAIFMTTLFFINHKNIRKIKAIGIVKSWLLPDKSRPSLEDQLKFCENRICFFGISARTTTHNPNFEKKIKCMPPGSEIQFLLLNPYCDVLKEKARDEGETPDAWVNDINSSIHRLRDLAQTYARHNIKIEVKIHDLFPMWRMLILDDDKIFLNYFLSAQRGSQSPMLEINKEKNGIFNAYEIQFKKAWAEAKIPN